MKRSTAFLRRAVLTVLAFACCIVGFGQGKFTVNGRLKIEGGDMGGSRAVLYKNGEKERVITTNLNKFSLDLDLNANYLISFEKDGYVSKKISFNTKVPASAVMTPFTPFDYAVSLFKQYDDINIVVFNQPVGIIRYEAALGDFDYDTDYTKSIQSQLQDVLDQVEKKQKEEERNGAKEAKRKADEAKVLAKAEAEAKKLAEAQAREEAERAEQAKREQEEREAAARKEADRAKAEANTPPPPAITPPPPPVRVKEEQPRPLPTPTPVRYDMARADPIEGEEGRRTVEPTMAYEDPRVAPARAVHGTEERPNEVRSEPVTVRNEELIVEPTKVMAVIQLETDGVLTEFRKVTHKWGGVYYFKNGATCTQEVFEREAQREELAGATPRSKLD
ncbi:MAG: hypothetical protein R2815_02875 [Flavobacteriales bacterium]